MTRKGTFLNINNSRKAPSKGKDEFLDGKQMGQGHWCGAWVKWGWGAWGPWTGEREVGWLRVGLWARLLWNLERGGSRRRPGASLARGWGGRESWGRGAHVVWQEGEASLLAGSCATEGGRRLAAAVAAGGLLTWQGCVCRGQGGWKLGQHSAGSSQSPTSWRGCRLVLLLVYVFSPSSFSKLAARRLLILFPHRLTAQAAEKCCIWAREARDPWFWSLVLILGLGHLS